MWMMKCIFGMQIIIEVFYKLISSFWVCVTRHAQSTQNKKFAIPLENHGAWSWLFACMPKVPKTTSLQYLCNVSRKAWRMKLMTVCFYHVAYAFQSESTLYSCLNVKELFARSRCEIWSLSDCNGTRTHNHLVQKWIFNLLAKLA